MTSTAVADSQATPQAEAPKRRFKLHVPTAFTILFILTVIAVAATWMVPAGSYLEAGIRFFEPDASGHLSSR